MVLASSRKEVGVLLQTRDLAHFTLVSLPQLLSYHLTPSNAVFDIAPGLMAAGVDYAIVDPLDEELKDFIRIVNERDDYALEQALLLKDRLGATVTVVAPDAPEVDDVLYAASAKGADRVVKVSGAVEGPGSRSLAAAMAATLP